jgi:hypothetical protein
MNIIKVKKVSGWGIRRKKSLRVGYEKKKEI